MFRKLLVLLICGLPLSVFAQKTIIINGRTIGGKIDSFIVANVTETTIGMPFQQYVKPNKDGAFQLKVPTKSQFNTVVIVHGKQRKDILLESGKILDLSLDFSNNAVNVKYDTLKNSVSHINEIYAQRGGLNAFQNKLNRAFNPDRSVFEESLNKLLSEEIQYVKSSIKNNQSLAAYYITQLELYKHNAKLMYAANVLNQQLQNIIPDSLNAIIQYSLSTPIIIDDKLMSYPIYQEYLVYRHLYGYIYNNLAQAADLSNNVNGAIKLLLAHHPKYKSASLGVAKLLQMTQSSLEASVWAKIVDDYAVAVNNDENAKTLTNIVAETSKFNAGRKAIDFEFVTLEGEKKKLSDYKGKVVYLDFWASWCGPCRQQMPYAKEIKKYFEGKDVVFLYVSIDDTDEKWKNGINNMQVEGVQTRSGGWGGAIPKLYNISSIPAYFLIDKNGNFAERPSRPSDKENLIKQIESLL